MARFFKDRSEAKDKAPGSLILIGHKKMEKPEIQVFQYDKFDLIEKEITEIEEVSAFLKPEKVTWINIYGIHDISLIQQVGNLFNYPPLFLQDLLNTDIRPKHENGLHYDAFILKMLYQDKAEIKITAEQITLILGENYVLTLQERVGDHFNPIRERIRNKMGRIRERGNDYLIYVLMDTIVDNYTMLIEGIGSQVEELEDRIFHNRDTNIASDIYKFKTELSFLRKAIRPVRDFLFQLVKSDNSYFQDDHMKYLIDLEDLVIQSTDTIELYNSLVTDLLNMYNTNMNNSLNEVMKVLTIFASIFIPLTFLAGIYGMNFKYLPELGFRYSYPIFWIVVLFIGAGMVIFLRRKKWL